MVNVEDAKKWAAMQAEWQVVNQEACTARLRVMQAFKKPVSGDGGGPTTAQIELAEKLEQVADERRLAMDEFVTQVFS